MSVLKDIVQKGIVKCLNYIFNITYISLKS